MSEAQIDDPRSVMTTAQHFQLLHNLIATANRPGLGLAIGQSAKIEGLGILGFAMLSAPSLLEALQVGARYAPVGGALGELAGEVWSARDLRVDTGSG